MFDSGSLTHSSPSAGADAREKRNFLDRERIRLLHRNNGVVLLATGLLAVLICLTLRPIVDDRVIVGWLLAYGVVTLVRFAAFYIYRRDANRFSSVTWHRVYVAGATLAGSAWGAGALLFFTPEQPEYMLLLTCLYAVVVAVGSQALSTSMPAFLMFSTTMILPLMGKLVAAGGNFYQPIGLMGFLYLLAISGFARNNNRSVLEAIRLRYENRELVERLSEEKSKADASRREAEDANLAKSRFLAAASHDLRQPLHALGLFQDALEAHVSKDGEPIMQRMKASIDALGGLFDGLLDISKLDAGVVEVHERDTMIRPLLTSLVAEFRVEAEEKGLKLDFESDDEAVRADPIMLERVIRNLLSNAIRYTDHGAVSLTGRRAGDRIDIMVTDTGCGIPEKDLENVFSEYHQLSSPYRDRAKGFGLGLAIVRRLCRLMNVSLTVDSNEGSGSTFTVTLPLGDKTERKSAAPAPRWDLRGAEILVVDDEPDILDSMSAVLTRWGCRTRTAASADEAVRVATAGDEPLTAIVADYRLGDDATGIDAIARVRAALETEIPALLVSGDTAPSRLRDVADSGLRLLHKPVSPAALRTALFQEVINSRSGPDRAA